MTRRITNTMIMCVVALYLLLGSVASSIAGENIFVPAIERSVDQAIEAWINADQLALKQAIKRLTLNEAYLLAISNSSTKVSYLSLVPPELTHNLNCVAAYLYLIKANREGIELWPKSFFEGRQFILKVRGGAGWKQ